MADTSEKRLSFTIVLLGAVAISSLFICGFVSGLQSVEKIALLIVTLGSLVLMLYAPSSALPQIDVAKSKDGDFKVSIGIVPQETGAVKTAVVVDPRITEGKEITDNEKAVRDKLFEIIEDGLTDDCCREGLKLLNRNKTTVKNSWRLTLNKARLLAFLRQFKEAEKIAADVIGKFPAKSLAVSAAYEVLSWIEELQEPAEKGVIYQQWLEKRKSYVMKGIESYADNHALLMNGFEIASLQGNESEALDFLNRAISVNRKLTKETLAVLRLAKKPAVTEEKQLSLKIKRTMEELMKGDKKMRIFNIIRASVLFLVIFLVCTVVTAFSLSNNDNRFRLKEVSPSSSADLERAGKRRKPVIKNPDCVLRCGVANSGKSIKKLKLDGTIFNIA